MKVKLKLTVFYIVIFVVLTAAAVLTALAFLPKSEKLMRTEIEDFSVIIYNDVYIDGNEIHGSEDGSVMTFLREPNKSSSAAFEDNIIGLYKEYGMLSSTDEDLNPLYSVYGEDKLSGQNAYGDFMIDGKTVFVHLTVIDDGSGGAITIIRRTTNHEDFETFGRIIQTISIEGITEPA